MAKTESGAYEAACLDAAYRQDLGPLLERLGELDIEHTLWQSGGFTMIVVVGYGGSGAVAMVTASETSDGDAYLMINQPHGWPCDCGACGDSEEVVFPDAPLATVIDRLVKLRSPHGARSVA